MQPGTVLSVSEGITGGERDSSTDKIHVADVGLEGDGIQAGHNRLHEEWSEPSLVEHVGDHVGEGLGPHLSGLLQLVHIHPELNFLFDSLDVGGEARQSYP